MRFMLDTNIRIYLIRRHPAQVVAKLKGHDFQDLCLSTIVLSELEYGVFKSEHRAKNRIALTKYLVPFEIVAFDDHAARVYREIRAELEGKGNCIGPYDLQIAAHAIASGVTLITHNGREFSRIPGLSVEDWV